MEKVFEYKVVVDSEEVDLATEKVKDLNETIQEGSNESANSMESIGSAAKKTGGAFSSLGTVGKTAFTGLGKGFTKVTGATQGFSKALLANPIFLLVAVILPIIEMLKGMLDKMGLLTIVTDALSNALDFLVSMLKTVSTALGLADGEETFEATRESVDEANGSLQYQINLLGKITTANAKLLRATGKEQQAKELEAKSAKEILLLQLEQIDNEKLLVKENIKRSEASRELNLELLKSLPGGLALYDPSDKLKEEAVLRQQLLDLDKEKNALGVGFTADIIKNNNDRLDAIEKEDELDKTTGDAKRKRQEVDRKNRIALELQTERMLQDIKLSLVTETTETQLEANRIKYERLREDAVTNENLTVDQLKEITAAYNQQEIEAAEAINEKKQAALIAKTIILSELELQLMESRFAAITEASQLNDESTLQDKLAFIRTKYEQEQLLLEEQKILDLEKLMIDRDNELISLEEFEAKKALILQKYDNETSKLKIENIKNNSVAKQDASDIELALEEANANAKKNLINAVSSVLTDSLEAGSAEAKAFSLAQAVYSTYQGVNAALAQTTDVTPTQSLRFGNAIAVGIAGLLNVKKILSTPKKTKSASASVSVPKPSTNASAINTDSDKGPDVNFFGPGGTGSKGDSSQFGVEDKEDKPIRAVVSWNDIDAVGSADAKVRRQMQL